ncbi:DUF302 domain-containing protein [Thermoanaerobacter thermohydrosulfuricus]|nr:DUF302 domain-containing protein [Thermoanaerobacter sp. RKWS2]UZQ82672.1 DUF302 domain-containing protein [Thermoanaerobacter sp. RKWS2]
MRGEKTMFDFTLTTYKKTKELIEDLKKELKEENFGVLWEFELHKKLAEKGLPYNHSVTILEVCNPNAAAKIIAIDPMASYFLPCKIVIIEDTKETKVGVLKLAQLFSHMDSDNVEIKDIAKEIEERLIKIINKVV